MGLFGIVSGASSSVRNLRVDGVVHNAGGNVTGGVVGQLRQKYITYTTTSTAQTL